MKQLRLLLRAPHNLKHFQQPRQNAPMPVALLDRRFDAELHVVVFQRERTMVVDHQITRVLGAALYSVPGSTDSGALLIFKNCSIAIRTSSEREGM